MPDVAAGQWLGEWQLEERIGSGGFAVVHRARSGTQVAAVKVLTDPRLVAQLQRNPASLALEHEHAVTTLEAQLEADPPHLVLELLGGGSLRDLLGDGALPVGRASELVLQIASALDYAHGQGVLHLDIKPENVLLDGAGRARLVDFGSVGGAGAELRQSLALSQELGIAGTPDYAAPEVRYADGVVDRRADVYSLAVLAFELLTGRLPLGLDRPSELRSGLPSAVDDVLAAGMARDPERRTLSAGAFAADLATALSQAPVADAPGTEESAVASRPEAPPPLITQPRVFARWVALILALLLVPVLWIAIDEGRLTVRDPAPPWVEELFAAASPQERVGLLLPIEDLGAPSRGWGRDGSELLASFPSGRPPFRLWLRDGYAGLYERSERDALAREQGCQVAVHAVFPAEGADVACDGLLFLVDLPSYEMRAATAPDDWQVASLVGRLEPLRTLVHENHPLVILPSLDSRLRVTNRSLAWFDAQLTAGVVRTGHLPVRARGGIAQRLRAFGGDARRAVSAGATLQCVYDHQAGEVAVTVRETKSGAALLSLRTELKLEDYEPDEDAAAFSVDPTALSLLEHEDAAAVIAAGLEQARALLYEKEPERAQLVLDLLRARGEPFASNVDVCLLLAQAHLDQRHVQAALGVLEASLAAHPQEARLRLVFARACLDEAQRLYLSGKGRWYQDDDESRFVAAQALLERLDPLKLDGPLADELSELRARLDGEL